MTVGGKNNGFCFYEPARTGCFHSSGCHFQCVREPEYNRALLLSGAHLMWAVVYVQNTNANIYIYIMYSIKASKKISLARKSFWEELGGQTGGQKI